MRFELGKCYEHTTGHQLFICGLADTMLYGYGFVAENGFNQEKLPEYREMLSKNSKDTKIYASPLKLFDTYSIVGMKEEHTIGFNEISKEEFYKNNFS